MIESGCVLSRRFGSPCRLLCASCAPLVQTRMQFDYAARCAITSFLFAFRLRFCFSLPISSSLRLPFLFRLLALHSSPRHLVSAQYLPVRTRLFTFPPHWLWALFSRRPLWANAASSPPSHGSDKARHVLFRKAPPARRLLIGRYGRRPRDVDRASQQDPSSAGRLPLLSTHVAAVFMLQLRSLAVDTGQ